MPLYGLLRKWMPAPAATLVFVLVYAGMIAAIVLLLPVTPTDFRYARY
jgi:uncharacterized membrane protein YccC